MRRFSLIYLLVCLLPLLVHAQEPANLLTNGDLSGEFAPEETFRNVPEGWHFVVMSGSPDSDRSTWPTYSRSTPAAWKFVGRNQNTWQAAGYQVVETEPGTRYQLTANVFSWTCNDPTTACVDSSGKRFSNEESGARARIGIDPDGGTDPEAASLIWSEWESSFDQYTEITLEADAGGDQLTVFLMADSGSAMTYNEAYWDDITLAAVGGAVSSASEQTEAVVVEPTHTPTSAPTASPTLRPTANPTTTPSPRPTASVTPTRSGPIIAPPPSRTPDPSAPTVTPEPTTQPEQMTPAIIDETAAPVDVAALPDVLATTGRLCIAQFEDTNQNTRQDEGEILLAGGSVQVEEESHSILNNSEPYCLNDLPTDRYTVTASLPDGFGILTSPSYEVEVQPGKTTTVYFAASEGFIAPVIADPPLETLAPPIPPFQQKVDVETEKEPTTLDRLYDYSAYIVLSLAVSVLLGGSALVVLMRGSRR